MPQENTFQTQRQKKSFQPCITWKIYSLSETHHKKPEMKFSRQKENDITWQYGSMYINEEHQNRNKYPRYFICDLKTSIDIDLFKQT